MNDGKNMAGAQEKHTCEATERLPRLYEQIHGLEDALMQRNADKADAIRQCNDLRRQLADSQQKTAPSIGSKNMAGMVSEKVQACSDGFCDWAAREQAAREAVGRFSPKERAVMYWVATDAAKAPCCPCFTGSVLGCLCACHRLGSATGVATLGGYVGHGIAQLARAPGKQFTRSDILAILRAQMALSDDGTRHLETLKTVSAIFENLE